MKRWFPVFQPVLLAIFPVLYLYLANNTDVPAADATRPLLISAVLAITLFAVSWLWLRERKKAGLASSLVVIALFSYGHIYDGLKLLGVSGSVLVRHRVLVPSILLLLVLVLVVIRRMERITALSEFLSVVAVTAVVLPILTNLGTVAPRLTEGNGRKEPGECLLAAPAGGPLPDVYFIVMDAYERQDVLLRLHGFDNGPFIGALEERGFYVPPAAMSNYRFTVLSLASILNMDYLQSFPDRYDPSSQNRWGVAQMIRDNRVRRELECIGYVTVTVDSGVYWTDWNDADFYLAEGNDPFDSSLVLPHATRFETLLLETTMARAGLDAMRQAGHGDLPEELDQRAAHRDRVLFQLAKLPELVSFPSPKLVYVHIVSPHPPFVFQSEEGDHSIGQFEEEFAAQGDDKALLESYAETVSYLNGRLVDAIDQILAKSTQEPVIVITADHGWAESGPEDKLSILQAYHFPAGKDETLYPTISAVNTFRIIFDSVFGTSMGELPDASYYSVLGDIWNFKQVENSWDE